MANYTTQDIKELRESTGAGMLDVKKALDEAAGDRAKAVEILRIKGLKNAAKREDRTTAQGAIASAGNSAAAVLVELNCETDFVAKSERFVELAQRFADMAFDAGVTTRDQLLHISIDGSLAEEFMKDKSAAFGEKVSLGRFARLEGGSVDAYLHRASADLPPQLGVLLAAKNASAPEVIHDIAIHIAALAPQYLRRDDVPAEVIENERRIAEKTTRAEGKPEAAISKIVEGRLNGFFKEAVLLEQPFAKDAKKTVGHVVEQASASITDFVRIRVGS